MKLNSCNLRKRDQHDYTPKNCTQDRYLSYDVSDTSAAHLNLLSY
jgi:hypothetical protein